MKSFGQDSISVAVDTSCPQQDLPQLLRNWLGKPQKPPKTSTLFLVPTIGSNPAMGFMFGFGGQYAFKLQDPVSLYSLINAGVTFTTKKQLIIQVKNNIYTKNNKFFLSGDWRFLKYSQPTYGLSTKAPDSGLARHQFALYGVETASDSLVQPMKFNFIRFYQTVNIKIKKSFYMGIGYHYDYYYHIVDEKLDTASPPFLTSHYVYSKKYGFNPEKYTLSGVSLNFVLDTRDNMVNAYKGYFANLNYRFYPEFLGNKKTGNYWEVEYRSFHSLSQKNPRHVLAFWLLGNFSPYGQLPYLDLPALGYDQRGRSGRGYTQGRYRGPNMVYAETEYRFPISPCSGILGGVLFVNATSADRPDGNVKLFDYIAPGYGMGLRIMIDKYSRTNLQVDFGFGKHSSGFYLGASETF
jgi:outer membrane protein assembly factor BamA